MSIIQQHLLNPNCTMSNFLPVSSSSLHLNHHLQFPKPNFQFHGNKRGGRRWPIRAVSAAASTDYYSALNVPRNATLQDIKTSYRKLARKYHPDLNKGAEAEENFKKIAAAYEVLSDDEKRSSYDRFGEAGLRGEYGDSDGGAQGVDPFDVFESFFGGSNGIFGEQGDIRRNGNQNLDIRYDLFLSFEESVFGGKREIDFPFSETCQNCSGSGAKSSDCIKVCTECGGRGGTMKTQKTPFGIISQVSTCSSCGGAGEIITDHCRSCSGHGKVQSTRSIKVVIPSGVSDGATMQLKGEGNSDSIRGVNGDLFLVLRVKQKQGIWRDGVHLYSKVHVDYTDAILGTVLKVETVEGLRDLQIPSGIQPGDTVKLSSMGVPHINKPSSRGDHRFIVNVLIPKDISDEERVLVENLASLKASYKNDSSPSSGTPHGDFDKHEKNVQSTHDSKHGAYIWNSVKNLFGGRKSGKGFASVSIETPPPSLWRHKRSSDYSIVMFISTSFIITFAFTSMFRTAYRAILQRKSRPVAPSSEKSKDGCRILF